MEQDPIKRDLDILVDMVSHLDAYLPDASTHWQMAEPDRPKLTIGGCLMRLERLHVLSHHFSPDDQQRLQQVTTQFDQLTQKSVVQFETKTHQELHARLHEWVAYLADLSQHMIADPDYFADKVDTRVVVTAMVKKMSTRPYHLDSQINIELESLDGNLYRRWHPGAFVWDTIWQTAYPEATYWYLYGMPR